MIPPGHIDRQLVLEAAALLEIVTDAGWVEVQGNRSDPWRSVSLSRDWFQRAEAVAALLAKQCANGQCEE